MRGRNAFSYQTPACDGGTASMDRHESTWLTESQVAVEQNSSPTRQLELARRVMREDSEVLLALSKL